MERKKIQVAKFKGRDLEPCSTCTHPLFAFHDTERTHATCAAIALRTERELREGRCDYYIYMPS